MTGDRHATKDSGDKNKASSEPESGLSFHGIMGHLKTAKDAVVDGGSKVIKGGTELIKETAPKVEDAAVRAANSDAGKKAIKVGKDVYEDEKQHVVGIGDAAKKGDVKTLVREGAPLLAGGPAGVIADRALGQAMKQGVKALPAEHQGTAKGVLEVGKLAHGGIPNANDVIVGTVLDSDKRGKAASVASDAGNAVVSGVKKGWGWITGGHSEGDAKGEAKAGTKAEKPDYPSDYPDQEKPQDLPKRKATKK